MPLLDDSFRRQGVQPMPLPDEALPVRGTFGALYAPLFRYLLARLPKREDAEDLAQEAFLRLLRVPRTDLIAHPDAYLFRIAANLLLEFRLRAKRSRVTFDSERADRLSQVLGAEDEPSAKVELLADAASLQQAIETLPLKCRTALVLHRRDGLTYSQIGAKLGVSPDMVKKYLAQAVARCRIALGEER
jgi:RNA polymerase sigma factor (sigma-70 family)